MKIDITYEKRDIIRLVRNDLARREIRIKAGSDPEYKGALQVKLSVEVEEDDTQPAPTTKLEPVVKPPTDDDIVVDGDMTSVLEQSRKVADSTPPLKRRLSKNESTDYPE